MVQRRQIPKGHVGKEVKNKGQIPVSIRYWWLQRKRNVYISASPIRNFIFCHFGGQTSIIIPMHVLFKKSHYGIFIGIVFSSKYTLCVEHIPPSLLLLLVPSAPSVSLVFDYNSLSHMHIRLYVSTKNVRVTIVLITCVILENGSFSVCQKKKERTKRIIKKNLTRRPETVGTETSWLCCFCLHTSL